MVTVSYFFTPIKYNTKAHVEYYTCDKTDSCPLYAQGKCACFRYILGSNQECPNSKFHYETGPTRRAKSYDAWLENVKYLYKSTVKEYKDKIAIVADYVFVPFILESYWTEYKVPDVINQHFFKLEDFTVDKIEKIVNYRPRDLYDPIKNKNEKNKFILQLKEVFPKLYDEWIEKYPDTAKSFINISHTGRTAYINSLPDGYIGNGFIKEGDYLINTQYKDSLFRGKFESSMPLDIKIKINDDMKIKLTDQNKVNETTKFVD